MRYEGQQFSRFYDEDSGKIFEDIEFVRCLFVSCRISMTRNPSLRSTVRNVKLIDCQQRGCALEGAVIEDSVVENFKTNGLLQSWGAVFRHVSFRGKIGRIMLSPAVKTGTATPQEQRMFDEANAAFYESVDWALDVSEAEVEEFDIRRVPARLIRRDPVSQIVVKRQKAMAGQWRKLDLSKTYWATSIQLFLDDGDPDLVLVAPKRHRRYLDFLEAIRLLRDADVAESD